MFRKGALLIAVLSVICSALFSWLVKGIFEDTVIVIAVFAVYFIIFSAAIGAIYDIVHKSKIKANKYLLGGSISAIIAFTSFFKALQYSSLCLGFVFMIAFMAFIILTNISASYERNDT